jgi:hypothetical protein
VYLSLSLSHPFLIPSSHSLPQLSNQASQQMKIAVDTVLASPSNIIRSPQNHSPPILFSFFAASLTQSAEQLEITRTTTNHLINITY